MSGMHLIHFKDKAKVKLVPIIHSLSTGRPGRYHGITASCTFLSMTSYLVFSGLWQSHTKASRDKLTAKGPMTLS